MSRHENISSDVRDVYATVTSQIVNAIEKGVGTWRMPWHTSGQYASSPINVSSRKAYRGISTLCLWAAAEAKGYASGEWGTYKPWQKRNAQVRKGEKSTTVVFWKFANGETQDGGEHDSTPSRLLFTRGYPVFNAHQVDGYQAKLEPEPTELERIEKAEAFFKGIGAQIRHGGNRQSTPPVPITFRCRHSEHSTRTRGIIRLSPTNTLTGQPSPNAVTDN